jgi:hypothetical protein
MRKAVRQAKSRSDDSGARPDMSAIPAPRDDPRAGRRVLIAWPESRQISSLRFNEVAITLVGVLSSAIVSIRPAKDRHLDAAVVIFTFDPPVARREPIFKDIGWFGHRLQETQGS